jgi:hypothetical protein
MMQSFYCTVHVRVVSYGLVVGDAKIRSDRGRYPKAGNPMKNKDMCTVSCGNDSRRNGFHPFRCTISDCEDIITIVAKF